MVLTKERVAHMHGVAEYMYENAPKYGLDPEEMFLLGYVHDIGCICKGKDPSTAGAELLAKNGYKDAYTVLMHTKELTDDDAESLKLQLLIEADMHVGMDGKDIGYDGRLDSAARNYGTDSRKYRQLKHNIEFLQEIEL